MKCDLNNYKHTISKTGTFEAAIQLKDAKVKVEITSDDIFDWLSKCEDINVVKYLGLYALKRMEFLENLRRS